MIRNQEYSQSLDLLFDNLNFREALETVCRKKYKDFEYKNEYTIKLAPVFQEYFSLDELETISDLYDDNQRQHELFDRIAEYNKEILRRSVFMMIKIHELVNGIC